MDENQLAQLYQEYLGRAPDPSGLATWSGQDPSAVIAGITGSPEYQASHSGDSGGGGGGGSPAPAPSSDPSSQVAQIYQSVLGRAPDAGAQGWIDAIAGGADPTQIAQQIASSQEGKNYAASNPQAQFSGLASLSQANNPLAGTTSAYNNMQYVGPTFASGESDSTGYQYKDSSGGTVTVDSSGNPVGYTPGPSWYQQQYAAHPDAIRSGYGGQQYLATGPLAQTQTINGVQVPITNAYEYQINPQTKALTTNPVYREQSSGGLGDFLVNNGWMLPLAMAGGAAAAEFLPGLLGETGLGAAEAMGPTYAELGYTPAATGATTSGLMGPTYQELGYTGLEAGQMGPTYGELGYTGLNNAEAIAAADAAATAGAGLTAADLLKYGIPLSKLIGGLTGGASTGAFGTGSGAGLKTTANPFGLNYTAGNTSNITNIPNLTPDLTKGNVNFTLMGAPTAAAPQTYALPEKQKFADGGEFEEEPQFYSVGGLESMNNHYVQGDGDGTSDSVNAKLADGEFVIPADVVAKLGNGSNNAGASVLDQFLTTIRKHKQENGTELEPDSKGPLAYLLDANKKAKA